jgi:membrane-bound ClpP family serine protease
MEKWLKVLSILGKYAEDFFIILGLVFIVAASFMISRIFGMYILGLVLLLVGLLMAIKPKGRR